MRQRWTGRLRQPEPLQARQLCRSTRGLRNARELIVTTVSGLTASEFVALDLLAAARRFQVRVLGVPHARDWVQEGEMGHHEVAKTREITLKQRPYVVIKHLPNRKGDPS